MGLLLEVWTAEMCGDALSVPLPLQLYMTCHVPPCEALMCKVVVRVLNTQPTLQ